MLPRLFHKLSNFGTQQPGLNRIESDSLKRSKKEHTVEDLDTDVRGVPQVAISKENAPKIATIILQNNPDQKKHLLMNLGTDVEYRSAFHPWSFVVEKGKGMAYFKRGTNDEISMRFARNDKTNDIEFHDIRSRQLS